MMNDSNWEFRLQCLLKHDYTLRTDLKNQFKAPILSHEHVGSVQGCFMHWLRFCLFESCWSQSQSVSDALKYYVTQNFITRTKLCFSLLKLCVKLFRLERTKKQSS